MLFITFVFLGVSTPFGAIFLSVVVLNTIIVISLESLIKKPTHP